ncbi:MAG: Na+/H+ antiporter subunit E [Actinomycetota bacterium]
MRYRLFLFAWLVFVWVALWRDPSVGNLVGGIAVAAVAMLVFPVPHQPGSLHVRPLAMAKFLGSALWAIAQANFVVAWEVLTPGSRVNEGVVAVDLREDHPVVTTMVSHAIGLAPGTLVIDVDDERDGPPRMFVHVLHLREIDDVRRDVLELERLALAAMGSPVAEGAEQ